MDRKTPPPVYTAGNIELPAPHTHTADNGIPLKWIDGGSQEVNQLTLIWTGGQDEAPSAEVAQIMAALLREGTHSMSGAAISEAIDFNGALLRAATDSHHTILSLTTLNSKTLGVLPIVSDVITDPSFPEQAFTAHRDMAEQNFRLSQTKVMTVCNRGIAPLVKGPDHPQARVPEASDIAAISREEIIDNYRGVVTPRTCRAYLSGKITPAILDGYTRMIGGLGGEARGMAKTVVPYQPMEPQRVDLKLAGARQAAVEMAIPAPARSHPDYIPLRFTVMALGGYFGSRLMKNIREDKGYTYGIGAYLLGSAEGSYIDISAQTDKTYVDLVIEETAKEMRALASAPMGEEEMTRLRQHISSTLLEILDSPFSIMDHYRVADTVGLPDGYFRQQTEWMRGLTPEIIMETAAKYLRPELLRVATCAD